MDNTPKKNEMKPIDDYNMNLNEMAINSKIPEIKNIPKVKKESSKYFDKFYYSMWLSNKD